MHPRLALVFAPLALALALPLACGSSSSGDVSTADSGVLADTAAGTDGDLPDVRDVGVVDAAPVDAPAVDTPSAFCAHTLAAVVTAYEACCNDADRATDRYKFIAGTFDVFKDRCDPQLSASASAGRIAYDPAVGANCAAAYAAVLAGGACGKDLTGPLDLGTFDVCGNAVHGKQAEGAACLRDYECLSGLTCVGYVGATDGKCTKPPAIGGACGAGKGTPAGEPVISLDFEAHPACADAAVCGATGKCAAATSAGGACTDARTCASGLTCHLGKCGTVGPSSEGGDCLRTSDCAGTTLYCEGATSSAAGKCTAKKKTGASCVYQAPFGGAMCEGRCSSPDGGTAGSCASFCGAG